MSSLFGNNISQTYQGLIKLADSTTGVTSTTQSLQDGLGNNIPIQVSNNTVNISGSFLVNGQPISFNTGSLVTTSSFNAYTSSVNIKLAGLDIETGSLQNQINGLATTGSLSGYTTVTTFNNYTGSNDAKVNELISKTGSYATITGQTALSSSIAVTDLSQNNRLTSLESVTGSINRNGLITTGSVGGTQSITGSLNVQGTLTATSASITYLETVYETASIIYSSGSNQLGDASNDTQTLWGTVVLPSGPFSVTGNTLLNGNVDITTGNLNVYSLQARFSGSTVVVTGSVDVSNGITGSLQGTASFATNALSSSFASNFDKTGLITTGSAAGTQSITGSVILSGSAGPELNVIGDVIITGSVIMSGSAGPELNVIGDQNNTGSVNISGSLNVVGPVGLNLIQPNPFKQNLTILGGVNQFTSSTVLNNYLNAITTSLNNNDNNFVFPPVGLPSGLATLTGSVFISGSNNLILNLGSGLPASQGRRHIFGSQNITTVSPTINTSSLTIPLISNNYLASTLALTLTTGSASGNSTHLFNTNVNLGSITWNHPSASITTGAAGSNVSNNIHVGGLTSIASGSLLTTQASITNNIISNAAITLNNISSSIQSSNSIIAGNNFIINNRYFHTGSNNFLASSANIIGGQGVTINTAGSPSTNVSRTLVGNILGGQAVTVSLEGAGTDLGGLRNSIVAGYGLTISGSHSAATTTQQGAAFFGRWNGEDNGLADSARTVFAVGTGTATGNRRTGFYITSGSLVGVSGSLDVKGNTTITGSLDVTGSVTIANAGDLTMYGHKMFNVGAFLSTQTQSGSANVSQSINYNTTDYSQGVSVVSGTRLTVANAGVYNIQFSAQVDRVSGSGTDTVHIWLKKNGTNVTNSAGAITISGGAAAAKTISSWNYVVDAAASDYYEICWQTTDANIQLINATATGNIPDIPSVIVTVTQVR